MKSGLFSQTSCIILSAGYSSRMGEHKALLKFDANTTLLQKITETYVQYGLNQVIVVVNKELYDYIHEQNIPLRAEVQLVVNLFPEKGRFCSLQSGVKILDKDKYCFFQNIDNPFTSAETLKTLDGYRDNADVLIPVFHSKAGHPVLCSPFVMRKIIAAVEVSDIRINDFLKQFNLKRIKISDKGILANINSREDYSNAGFRI